MNTNYNYSHRKSNQKIENPEETSSLMTAVILAVAGYVLVAITFVIGEAVELFLSGGLK